jgi:hypothetical protein
MRPPDRRVTRPVGAPGPGRLARRRVLPSGRNGLGRTARVTAKLAQGWVSRPVGRVLCARLRGAAIIHLGLPLPTASCGLPASIGRAALKRSRREPRFPSWPCSGWGLPSRRSHLWRWWSLTPPFHPYPREGAVCFLWHFPAGHPGSALPTTLPCGARTFLAGLAPGATARPTHPWPGYAGWHLP